MCGRYAMAVAPDQLPEYFAQTNLAVDKTIDAEFDSSISYNIGPTRSAPIYFYKIDDNHLTHVVQYAKWGLIPYWTKKSEDAMPWRRFNARMESLKERTPLWRSSMNKKRCVVPMQGYYEWLHKPVPGTKKVDKIPYYIKRKDNKLMYLAGLRDGCQYENTDEVFHTYTIVTGPAPKQLHWLHERMPIVLIPGTKEFDTWLDPNIQEWSDELLHCLNGYEKQDLEWYEVSQDVNKYASSGPDLIEPVKNTQKGIMSFFSNPAKSGEADVRQAPESDVKAQQPEIKNEYIEKVEAGSEEKSSGDKVKSEPTDEKPPKVKSEGGGNYKYESRKKTSPQKQNKRKSITDMVGDNSIAARIKKQKT